MGGPPGPPGGLLARPAPLPLPGTSPPLLGPSWALAGPSLFRLKDQHMYTLPSPQTQFSGWFLSGNPETSPSSQRCSIGAAVSTGQVMRHYRPGYLWLPDGRGAVSFETAIAEGICDAEAVEYIKRQPGCFNPNPQVGIASPKLPRPGTMEVFEGTPIGDLVKAIVLWGRNRESLDDQFKLAKAFEAVLGQ